MGAHAKEKYMYSPRAALVFVPGLEHVSDREQNPVRKGSAVAERHHKAAVTGAWRKGKGEERKAGLWKATKWGCWLQPRYLTVGQGML